MLTKSLLGLSLAACIASPTWADTTQWGRWSTIRFPARVGEMLSTGFYARTPSGSDVYIRQDQRVFRDGQLVNPVFLRPGDNVQVVVPAGKGQIRFRDDGVAVLSTPQGLAQVPEENLRLAYQDPYTTTAAASNSNYYLSTPSSNDSYSSANFYTPAPAYQNDYYYGTNQPYAYNYNNPQSGFRWENAAVSLLGTVLASTLNQNQYNPYFGYGQGYDPYYSTYNPGYSTYANYNYSYANYIPNWNQSNAYYGVNPYPPQIQRSNWSPTTIWVNQIPVKAWNNPRPWNHKNYGSNSYYRPQVQINSWNRNNYRVNNNHAQKRKNYGANYYRPQVRVNSWNRNNYRVTNNHPQKRKNSGAYYSKPQVRVSNWNRTNYRVNNQRPQVRANNWNGKHYRVNRTPQVRMNSFQQPRNSNHAPRAQFNYNRPQSRPQQNFQSGGGFRSAAQPRNFNPGGGHGGAHQGGGHGKGRH